MDFPAYVPIPAQEQITAMLYGENGKTDGWEHALKSANEHLESLELELRNCTPKKDAIPDDFRKKIMEATLHRNSIQDEVSCLKRLASDLRMKEAYEKLRDEFSSVQQWENFIDAAWRARIDYSQFRQRIEKAKSLSKEIERASKALETLLRKCQDTGFEAFPSTFFSIPELLKNTDNNNGNNFHMWQGLRHVIFGENATTYTPKNSDEKSAIKPGKIRIVAFDKKNYRANPIADLNSSIKYTWRFAPKLPDLLGTLSEHAGRFEPKEKEAIGEAISKREKNPKQEYLRALKAHLIEAYNFQTTTNLRHAIAATATVVLNKEDLQVTYDDVRKVFNK